MSIDAPPLMEDELNEIYNWIDTIPLSRPKKHIGRDFADGVLMAEVVNHYIPKLVELHNYSQAHSVQQKQYNWSTLNTKVFKKMDFQLTQNDVNAVINCVPEAVERVLKVVQKIRKTSPSNNRILQPIFQISISSRATQEDPKVEAKGNMEKDLIIQDQRETIEILELKIQKLEQLVKLKDSKIQTLSQKLQQAGIK